MKTYHFENVNNCLIYGSIGGMIDKLINDIIEHLPNKEGYSKEKHPKEIEREERMRQNEQLRQFAPQFIQPRLIQPRPVTNGSLKRKKCSNSIENCAIFVNGNSGLGTKDLKYHIDKFEALNKLLEKNNSHLLFIRGYLDDPQIFDSEAISLSNIKTIPDYSLVMLKCFNCLCIGGSISLDREWRKKQSALLGKNLYWENEGFVYKEDELDEILDKYDIACVITNTCPSFSFPGTNVFNNTKWKGNDPTLLDDILSERKLMDKVYNKFVDKNKKPYVWAYSFFMSPNGNMSNDIYFCSLRKLEVTNFNHTVLTKFGIDLKKEKMPSNDKVVDKIDNSNSTGYFDLPNNVGEEEDIELEDVEDDINGRLYVPNGVELVHAIADNIAAGEPVVGNYAVVNDYEINNAPF